MGKLVRGHCCNTDKKSQASVSVVVVEGEGMRRLIELVDFMRSVN